MSTACVPPAARAGGHGMDIGMLWYDDDEQRDLAQKVERAATYYAKKYGAAPTECWVNASLLAGGQAITVGTIRVQGSSVVIRNHLWLGIGSETL